MILVPLGNSPRELYYGWINLKLLRINPMEAGAFGKINDLEISVVLMGLRSFYDLLEGRYLKLPLGLEFVFDFDRANFFQGQDGFNNYVPERASS